MKNYNVSYKTETVTENKTVQRDLFSCITFDNVGTAPVKVNNVILKGGQTLEFSEDPNVIINTDFSIKFEPEDDATQIQLLHVITAFYKTTGNE